MNDFVQTCGQENWISTLKYLIDYLPLVLKTKDVKDVEEILSFVFVLLPTNFVEFVRWVSEVQRQEYRGPSLSKEERGRLADKEVLFKQVQETELFKHVSKWLSSKSLNYRKMPSLGGEDALSETAANVSSHGVELLTGKPDSSGGYCCRETCAKSLKANGHMPAEVVTDLSQTELNFCGSSPSDSIEMDSASNDVLTVLLLALPLHIWSSIKEEKLLKEIYSLVSTENLPPLLQEEVIILLFYFLSFS
ncbi:hypothetical protein HHK36_027007 [Tetracentron sinense]|uniref:Phytochelatin synthase C-terminal domain-containing protein n=1 Tax=Tetracentron sinense TaxID=13715 RepID=A0A834YMF3_TETSI|nr:hypothetical protein HHK36_027007 [Tetracentron sinense]